MDLIVYNNVEAHWQILISVACIAGLGGVYVYLWSVPTLQTFSPALLRGPAKGGRVALTFDDGPSSPYTEQILDILRSRNCKATFFVCGRNVERYPEILRRIQAEGHAIGNHTFTHPFPYFRTRSFFAREIDLTQNAIERVTGQRPEFFRPPFGARWLGMYPVLRERGMRLVNWSDTGYDWKLPAEGVVRETLKNLRAGSIILLHDGCRTDPPGRCDRSSTVEALPAIMDGALKAGLTFIPIHELLG
jgi:peptidoglycan/xylan/chitin deacetylase (PgdA/CDA1 family)